MDIKIILKFKVYYFLVAVLVLSSFRVHSKTNCDDMITQLDMNQCAQKQFLEIDSELNKLYKEIMRRLKKYDTLYSGDSLANELVEQLKKSQRVWIQFRDAECALVRIGLEGGSLVGLVYPQCLTQMTEKRVKELDKYLNCIDYDFSCPFPNKLILNEER